MSPRALVDELRAAARSLGSCEAVSITAYFEVRPSQKLDRIRGHLAAAGVTLVDCPHNGSKEVTPPDGNIEVWSNHLQRFCLQVADHAIVWDLAITKANAVVVVSNDRGYSRPLARLRLRGLRVGVAGWPTHPFAWPADRIWQLVNGKLLEVHNSEPLRTDAPAAAALSTSTIEPSLELYMPLVRVLALQPTGQAVPIEDAMRALGMKNFRSTYGLSFKQYIVRAQALDLIRLRESSLGRLLEPGADFEKVCCSSILTSHSES